MLVHYFPHIETAVYLAVVLLIIYKPPVITRGLGEFVASHFGDSVWIYILHLGVALVVLGGIFPQISGITQTGNSFILAGVAALKLVTRDDKVASFDVKASNPTEVTK